MTPADRRAMLLMLPAAIATCVVVWLVLVAVLSA